MAASVRSSVGGGLQLLGAQGVFVARVLGAIPRTIRYYRGEIFSILSDISWGTNAIIVGGGTVGVMVLISVSAGASLGIEGFNGLELIGLSPLTGFISATVNTRELAPLIAALALGAQVGCRYTAQIGSMRISEEIDAISVMAIEPIPFLVTTRLIATLFAIVPLYLIGLIGSYVAARLSVTLLFHQPVGTYMHYFEAFLSPTDILISLGKILIFTMVIVLIHCWFGFTATGGPAGVGEATGRAIRADIVIIVLIDMIFTLAVYGGNPGIRISG